MKPSIPKGTRDLGPNEMYRRNHIFSEIRKVFEIYGYQPIETPAMENLTTLLGKYGEEGDKLLFKILNSGDFLSGLKEAMLDDTAKLGSQISEKGLRYDLTVPFARFVVMNQNDLTFPFKRYQIQPVWRADRPQKGRYREFYQCDVDVIGSKSLLNEAELLEIADTVFRNLGLGIEIHLNNRKILSGIAEIINASDKIIDITIAIDKIEKIGLDKVVEELHAKGLEDSQIELLKPILLLEGDNESKLNSLKEKLSSSASGLMGIAEVEKILGYVKEANISSPVVLDLTLARGLDYYTGAIIEVKAREVNYGSICGGGRYDDLTGVFGLNNMSGVGISFGADRIYDVMNELGLFADHGSWGTKVLFVNFGPKEELYCLSVLAQLREEGISAEIYPDYDKLKKQLNYANKKNIRYVVLVGSEEMENGMLTLKDMEIGSQSTLPIDELVGRLG